MAKQSTPFDSLMYIVDRPPVRMVHGEGSWLWDETGRRYLDFVQGWAVNSLGHSPRVVVEALSAQAATLLNPSPAYYNAPMVELADLLTAHSVFDRVFFTSCGAEANEGAIKLARKWGSIHRKISGSDGASHNRNTGSDGASHNCNTGSDGASPSQGAYEIITMEHAFHGRTLATMSASDKPNWTTLYEPKVPGFPKAPLNDLAAVKALISERTVGVMLEPVQGEAGVFPAEDGYLRDLRALCDEVGILLILDEVQTGVGRTGKLFAYEWAGITPDIMTLAKGIGGGVPLAALLAREEICCFQAGDQGGTYCGNPLACAAGIAVMKEVLKPGFLEGVQEKGAHLTAGLERLSAKYGLAEVRGRGLLVALNLVKPISGAVTAEAMAAGVLLNAPRPDTLRFIPALTVSAEEIDAMLDVLDGAIAEALK